MADKLDGVKLRVISRSGGKVAAKKADIRNERFVGVVKGTACLHRGVSFQCWLSTNRKRDPRSVTAS